MYLLIKTMNNGSGYRETDINRELGRLLILHTYKGFND